MSLINTLPNGRSQINKVSSFCEILNHKIPDENIFFTDLLEHFNKLIRKEDNRITREALSNSHGDWYEWLLSISAWNISKRKYTYLALLLPNITTFDVAKLYETNLYNLIVDLRDKVEKAASVQLITSNPDYVIIDPTDLEIPDQLLEPIKEITPEIISMLQNAYLNFSGKCKFENIIGYISVKTSLRPDRRLQLAHEGSLMKALYTHLQTRNWIISPRGLKYYAIVTSATDSDINALKTVATHSITSVHTLPQAAVDHLFIVNSLSEANKTFKNILLPK